MALDFNVELKHFPDNVSLATTAAAIETWLDSLNISAVGAGLVPSGLLLDLPMDEGTGTTLTDRSGNSNNGTLLPLGSEPTWVDGKYGTALSFNGTDDYVAISDSNSLDVTTGITICAWIKATSIVNYARIIDKYRTTAYGFFTRTDGKLEFEAKIGGTKQTFDSVVGNFSAGSWYYVAVTYDSSGAVEFYVNGVNTDSFTASPIGNISTNVYPLWIGRDPTPGGDYFNGIIDEVRLYNRALVALEIKKLYYNRFQDRIHKIKIQYKAGFYEVKVIYV